MNLVVHIFNFYVRRDWWIELRSEEANIFDRLLLARYSKKETNGALQGLLRSKR